MVSTPSFACSLVIISGGAMRIELAPHLVRTRPLAPISLIRLLMTSRAGLPSEFTSSTATIRPFPRTSPMMGNSFCTSRNRRWM